LKPESFIFGLILLYYTSMVVGRWIKVPWDGTIDLTCLWTRIHGSNFNSSNWVFPRWFFDRWNSSNLI